LSSTLGVQWVACATPLLKHPDVQDCRTSFVHSQPKDRTALPL
jgi:hypothetical protein